MYQDIKKCSAFKDFCVQNHDQILNENTKHTNISSGIDDQTPKPGSNIHAFFTAILLKNNYNIQPT